MSHILITFLGTGKKGTDDFYETEKYHFYDDDDDTRYYEHNFFGLAVLDHLKNQDNPPNKLVILGTPSSMWNALFEINGKVDDDYEAYRSELSDTIDDYTIYHEDEAIEEKEVSKYFPKLKEALSKRLNGIDCELRIIPYGESEDKQIDILKEMAESVKDNDTVSLDITHGLRHLPMLVILSAMYLEVVKKVDIAGIYYGAEGIKNRHDDIAPALNLKGLLGIAKWYGALKSFDKDGDYGVFAQLLEGNKFKSAHLLKKAAYFERVIDIENATDKLDTVQKAIQKNGLEGISSLFNKQLQKRISWHKVNPSLDKKTQVYLQQRKLAFSYLDKGDYVRAANFALESLVTSFIEDGSNPYDYKAVREPVKKNLDEDYKNNYKFIKKEKYSQYCLLREIRNLLAHGNYENNSTNNKQARELLQNEDKLRSKLKELMENLLN